MNFVEKVRAMSAAEIIMAMVDGLTNPATIVEMTTFGYSKKGAEGAHTCFGCAATNTIANILDVSKERLATVGFCGEVSGWEPAVLRGLNFEMVEGMPVFVRDFEYAIDSLRVGRVAAYNRVARAHGFAEILYPDDFPSLPTLTTDSYLEDLPAYKALAEAQP